MVLSRIRWNTALILLCNFFCFLSITKSRQDEIDHVAHLFQKERRTKEMKALEAERRFKERALALAFISTFEG